MVQITTIVFFISIFPSLIFKHNLYELYYINKYRAFENRNGLAHDKLTITLPELEWKEYDYQKLEKIKAKNKGVGIRSMPKNFCYDDRYFMDTN